MPTKRRSPGLLDGTSPVTVPTCPCRVGVRVSGVLRVPAVPYVQFGSPTRDQGSPRGSSSRGGRREKDP